MPQGWLGRRGRGEEDRGRHEGGSGREAPVGLDQSGQAPPLHEHHLCVCVCVWYVYVVCMCQGSH